ncbi:hypothetical protein NKH18_31705 [Streptomyces sp. M10(2022)]
MAHFHHTVTVLPVDRAWLEECAGLLLDLVESTRSRGSEIVLPNGEPVADVRLVKGRHLSPGARYKASLDADRPDGEGGAGAGPRAGPGRNRGRTAHRAPDPDGPGVAAKQRHRRGAHHGVGRDDRPADGAAAQPARPRALDLNIAARSPEGPPAARLGRAKVDLAAWWAAAGIRPGLLRCSRPAVARAKHLLGRARLTLPARER